MKGDCKMRTTTTLEKAVQIVHDQSTTNYDQIVAVQDMHFDGLKHMDIAGQPFGVLPSAQRLLANRLRVPYSYLVRCPRELQADNLNYWIKQEARNRQSLFCRFTANNVRAIFTERYTAIDHMEVLTKILEYGFDPMAEVQLALDDEMMALNHPEYDKAFYLAGNDRIVPGISVANSEVGILALSIEAYYYRLVCTNGLVSKTAVDARYKHVSRKVMDEFPLVLENVVRQSREGQDRFLISTRTAVDNPESTIDTFARQLQISQEEAQVVKQAFYLEQGGSMFHIIQAFTRAAQFPNLSASDSYRLERAGGAILSMVKQ